MLEAARLTAPTDLFVLLMLADARKTAGETDGEFEAIQWALAVDPLYVPALLKKGSWCERQGKSLSACEAYSRAMTHSGSEAQWPGQLRAELGAARTYIERNSRGLHNFLAAEIRERLEELDSESADRWREAASIHAGRSGPYPSKSEQFHVPRLPAIPFFERSAFSRLEVLERNVDRIHDELAAVLERGQFQPYVAYPPGEPVNQWQALNHSSRWSAFHLWRDGKPIAGNLDRLPETAKLLEEVELCDLDGFGPSAFFSALAPKTHIPPHHGETNARVIAHLPLIVPDGCRLRVGFEERQWQEGKTLVFDDTIEHEAFNDSNALRVVMIFGLWNPLLSDADRHVASVLAEGRRNFAD